MEKRQDLPMNQKKKDIIYGIRSIEEALSSDTEIEKILVRKDHSNDLIKRILHEAYGLNIPIQKVPVQKINTYTRKNHQGILAFITAIRYASLDHIIHETFRQAKDPLLLMLDRITDVRNFGAISRTGEGLGFHAIILPSRGGALINQEAMKASAGALAHIPVCRVKNMARTLQYLQNHGIRGIACTEKGEELLYQINLTGPLVLILGSEGEGISAEILEICDEKARIPMYGRVNSFNVSVSMAIAGSEIVRQRLKDKD
jgi:23S rRNA (guanosine2251-2'-O)-methyltransferase